MFVVLNGPPQCGKDEAAKTILRYGKNFSHYKFSTPLKRVFSSILLLGEGTSRKFINEAKDIPQPLLDGDTPREVQIKFFKALSATFGDDILGRIAAREVKSRMSNVVISDSGCSEFDTFKKLVGPSNVYLVRIHREGCNFDSDNRAYLQHYQEVDIENKYDLEMYEHQIINVLKKWEMLRDE